MFSSFYTVITVDILENFSLFIDSVMVQFFTCIGYLLYFHFCLENIFNYKTSPLRDHFITQRNFLIDQSAFKRDPSSFKRTLDFLEPIEPHICAKIPKKEIYRFVRMQSRSISSRQCIFFSLLIRTHLAAVIELFIKKNTLFWFLSDKACQYYDRSY